MADIANTSAAAQTAGVTAQGTAAPAAGKDTFLKGADIIDEIDDTDDEVVIVDEDEDGGSSEEAPIVSDKTAPKQAEPDRNAVYADIRRKAEAEARVKATAEAQRLAQAEVDKVFAGMGLTDPYTNKTIRTKAEYDAYKTRHDSETISKELGKAGISREAMDAIIDSHPAVLQAKTAAKAYEAAQRSAQENAAKSRFESQLSEISKIDPAIKTAEDLMGLPNIDAIKGYTKKGLSIVEAYKLANIDNLTGKKAEAAAQTAYNKAASKDHLTSTSVRGQGEISMPRQQLEWYRKITGKTDKQIREDYAKHVKKYQKG